ncbi:MAG: DUF2007 domain-containing protein [Methyloversatilis sp.]|jgi:hypothetical protein|nr:DUF2007 domain-containing protein [Methyloversatilis sp.]MBP6194035.1 DUF2007 domain-containing protein [Methyloversatilis sp.]MBP9116953.1 DUF2007 domain-containing protein [Methyloversatilis sp.]
MRILYEASSAVEAHLLKDLLAQEGVPASIHGEFLQGAMGELPAAGLVRLMVADEHYAAGRALIARWEAAATSGHDDSHDDAVRPAADDRRRTPTRNPRGMWIAVAIVAAACWLYARALEASIGDCGECRVPDAGSHVIVAAPEALSS